MFWRTNDGGLIMHTMIQVVTMWYLPGLPWSTSTVLANDVATRTESSSVTVPSPHTPDPSNAFAMHMP